MTQWHGFNDFDGLNESLAITMATHLQEQINRCGQAVLAVSGGNSPKPLFHYLSLQEIDWSRVTILLVDERWVATDQADSNENTVRQFLLKNHGQAAHFVGLKTHHHTAKLGQNFCNAQLENIPGIDVLLLGMGDDGHTASIFPCLQNAQLTQLLDINNTLKAMAVTPLSAPHERMTLTAAYLLTSKYRYLLIKGENKKHVYEQALNHEDKASMPIRLFLHATDAPLHVYFSQ